MACADFGVLAVAPTCGWGAMAASAPLTGGGLSLASLPFFAAVLDLAAVAFGWRLLWRAVVPDLLCFGGRQLQAATVSRTDVIPFGVRVDRQSVEICRVEELLPIIVLEAVFQKARRANGAFVSGRLAEYDRQQAASVARSRLR